jgi:hypothetical protein
LSVRVSRAVLAVAMPLALLVAACAEGASTAPSVGSNGDSPVVTAAAASRDQVPSPTASSASPSTSPAAGYTNPVFVNDAPDPSVIRADDGAFYAYTTQAYHGADFTTLPILRSTDLVTWELVGDAFAGEARPGWIIPGKGSGDVWAPHIARIGG